jgi:hypothetical protein
MNEQEKEQLFNLTSASISNRVRVTAMIELLIEKGVFTQREFEKKFDIVFEDDFEKYKKDLLGNSEE